MVRRTSLRRLTGVSLATLAVAAGAFGASACSEDNSSSGSGDGAAASALDPASLVPAEIVGRGPSGEKAALPGDVELTSEESAMAKKAGFEVGIVMQTLDIDWSTQQVKGITDTLEKHGAEVIGVIDPQFKVDKQIAGIQNMVQRKPDAIISIPVDDTATAPAYKTISQAGIKLILMDNVPRGLQYTQEYQSMVSSDNQGDGQIAAQVLAESIPEGGTVGVLGFGVDFFVTAEREAGFNKWIEANRPDIKIKRETFLDPSDAGNVAQNFLTANPDIEGFFTVWEVPAMGIVNALRQQGKEVPITSINLALEVANDMARGGLIKGVGAQVPYDQGVSEANAALKTLLGKETPQWVAWPAVPVIPSNLTQGYDEVFHAEPPADLVEACSSTDGCG